ncbi:unnamed protein product [Caenorhabditis auriculariae]|uniref:Uncharacterized protein n=1 Tax=Caenorhabditis auriculariae TaxID=2777116 RepID=A0A8S1HUU7_9PELO|nr:unnamed protein product [Caenorhabditis auriculariae]
MKKKVETHIELKLLELLQYFLVTRLQELQAVAFSTIFATIDSILIASIVKTEKGTSKGFTAIQLDMKIPGMRRKQLSEAMAAGQKGVDFVLNEMNAVRSKPRFVLRKAASHYTTPPADS